MDWFRTGDIGAIDTDGYVSIAGRAKELIITGAYNVYPREVEDVLRAHPSVGDVAIAGTPSAEWGETVTAYVEAGEGFDADALLAWAADQLVTYKRPCLVAPRRCPAAQPPGQVLRHEFQPPI